MVAVYAVACLALLSAVFCALSAVFSWRAAQQALKVRSMTSLQGELAEIRDYMGKMDRWAKRINAREVMQEHRDPASGQRRPSSETAFSEKDDLRRRAGLSLQKVPRHGSDA